MSYEEQRTDDTETRMLGALAEGRAYVFLTAHIPDDDSPIQIGLTCGGGITGVRDVRFVLNMALAQLPEG